MDNKIIEKQGELLSSPYLSKRKQKAFLKLEYCQTNSKA